MRKCPKFISRPNNAGFTLMELLIALAIASLTSLALFQSIGVWFTVSAKTTQAAERAIGDLVHERQFRNIVAGLTSAWPDQPEQTFKGNPDSFTGLTDQTLHTSEPSLEMISLVLRQRRDSGSGLNGGIDSGQLDLIYTPEDPETKTDPDRQQDDESWVLNTYAARTGRFTYLGADGVWYPAWPPSATPDPSPFGDGAFFDTPQLPLAIKLEIAQSQTAFNDTFNTDQRITHILIAPVGSTSQLPRRDADISRQIERGF